MSLVIAKTEDAGAGIPVPTQLAGENPTQESERGERPVIQFILTVNTSKSQVRQKSKMVTRNII